jgi:hypothetical protein
MLCCYGVRRLLPALPVSFGSADDSTQPQRADVALERVRCSVERCYCRTTDTKPAHL